MLLSNAKQILAQYMVKEGNITMMVKVKGVFMLLDQIPFSRLPLKYRRMLNWKIFVWEKVTEKISRYETEN